MPFWIQARSVWVREETSKTFSGTVFASTRLVSELPYAVVNATVFFLLEYYIIGFQTTSTRMGYFFVMIFFTEIFGITLGSMIASFCKSIYVSSLFIPFVMMILSLTAGVVMPPQNMGNPLFYRFLYNVNPLRTYPAIPSASVCIATDTLARLPDFGPGGQRIRGPQSGLRHDRALPDHPSRKHHVSGVLGSIHRHGWRLRG